MLRLQVPTVIAVFAIFIASGLAQRPSNASTCDYYAQAAYGANTSDTQLKLVQSIVSLAFAGGANISNISSELTGILNPGSFQGQDVDLQPFFNGSIASTNLNNAPIGIDWLDQGGRDPLVDFLNGVTDTPTFANTSNQHHLFGNFFVAFSHAFGCTLPPPPLPSSGGPLSLAYVHKFMNLTFNDLGHFIDQLTLASEHFGFSDEDGATFSTRLNSLYNVRCAPPVTFNPAQGPQLLSLCQNPTCPLAAPVSDCNDYVNLTANGLASSSAASSATSTSQSSSATSASSSSVSSSTSSTSATPTSSPASAPAAKSLSNGGIAGVAVGGAAVLVFAALGLMFCLKRRRKEEPQPEPIPAGEYRDQHYSAPPEHLTPYAAKDPHASYYSTGPPASEMDSTMYAGSVPHSPGVGSPRSPRVGSPEMATNPNHYSHPMGMGNAPVEMASGEYVDPAWHGENNHMQGR